MVSLSYYHNPKQHIRIDEQAKKAVIVPLFFLSKKKSDSSQSQNTPTISHLLAKQNTKLICFWCPCLLTFLWCKENKHAWHEAAGCVRIFLIISTFWDWLFMKIWNINDWVVSQIIGKDLRCSGLCLYFYNYLFSKMLSQSGEGDLRASNSKFFSIFHSFWLGRQNTPSLRNKFAWYDVSNFLCAHTITSGVSRPCSVYSLFLQVHRTPNH